VDKINAAIIATEIKLSNAATALQTLSKNTAISAADFVKERNRLTNELSDLHAELAVLEERLDAARLGDAKRAHEAKVNGVSLILKRRLALMEALDEALENAAEAATEISRIDRDELAGDIAGIDARFELLRKQWMHVAINRMASLGLGIDRRLDSSVPVPTMADYSAAQHKVILSELAAKKPTRLEDIPPSAPDTPSAPSAVSATPSDKQAQIQLEPRAKGARYIEVSA
jgi:hypothetical protein